jgi:dihydroorotate dehydrogenase
MTAKASKAVDAGDLVWSVARRVLFALAAERAHRLVHSSLRPTPVWRLVGAGPPTDPRLVTRLGTVTLASPIGLAPGFDKDCDVLGSLGQLGFSFLAAGSIMQRPRSGNPRPRLARLEREDAILNAMGLPSRGIEHALARLRKLGRPPVPLFLDVQGETPEEILDNFRRVQPFAAAIEISLVCPNTADTDANASLPAIDSLCARIMAEATVPVFVKIPVEFRTADHLTLGRFLETCVSHRVDGVIACGARHIRTTRLALGHGQLGGRPVYGDTLRLVRRIRAITGDRLLIIASGGIFSGDDVLEVLEAGASATEIYSALVYRGPRAPARMAQELVHAMRRRGVTSVLSLRD